MLVALAKAEPRACPWHEQGAASAVSVALDTRFRRYDGETFGCQMLERYHLKRPTMRPTADYSHFDALDIRVGRITKVEHAATKKPTYRLTIDFGHEIGLKVSCGAYRNYAPDQLLGKQIIGIVNFAEKKMGPEVSQVLVLGVPNDQGETIYLMPQTDVPLGAKTF